MKKETKETLLVISAICVVIALVLKDVWMLIFSILAAICFKISLWNEE
jgi:hypothetical protein